MKDIITIIATIKKYIDSHVNESVECIETSAGILNNQDSVFELTSYFLLALHDLAIAG